MLAVDLYNAINDWQVDNYTCQLFRLLLKADIYHKRKLASVYPVEAAMVQIYHNDCPVDASGNPDWQAIETAAIRKNKGAGREYCQWSPHEAKGMPYWYGECGIYEAIPDGPGTWRHCPKCGKQIKRK